MGNIRDLYKLSPPLGTFSEYCVFIDVKVEVHLILSGWSVSAVGVCVQLPLEDESLSISD